MHTNWNNLDEAVPLSKLKVCFDGEITNRICFVNSSSVFTWTFESALLIFIIFFLYAYFVMTFSIPLSSYQYIVILFII